MDSTVEELIVAGAIIAAAILAFYLWELLRSAWFAVSAHVKGWSDEERFEREAAWIDREARREQRLQSNDVKFTRDNERKRFGAVMATVAVGIVAYHVDMEWWWLAATVGLTVFGLHMIAGVSIRWWS